MCILAARKRGEWDAAMLIQAAMAKSPISDSAFLRRVRIAGGNGGHVHRQYRAVSENLSGAA